MKKGSIKRILSILQLVLICCFIAMPTPAAALSGSTGGLNWTLSAGTLVISGSGSMPDYTDANMPPWYGSAESISRIVVGEGVTSVGTLAFYGCSTAVRATLPSTVKTIGDRAFKNCDDLAYTTLPEGIVSIGEASFEGCAALNGIILPESLQTISDFAFDRCTSLTSIVIPSETTDLGMVVFYNCTSLTRAEIRSAVDKLPDWFFYGCTALSDVVLPETVTQTGDQVFHNCENLNTVYYSGDASGVISDTLLADSSTRHAVVDDSIGNVTRPKSSSTIFNEEEATSTTITVTQTEQAVITETSKTEYSCTLNGESVTMSEAMNAPETENVEISGETNTVISATVSGSEGWKDVTAAVTDAAANRSDSKDVEVTVQLTGSTVSGKSLAGLSGINADLKVATDTGCVWAIDTENQSKRSFSSEDIELDFSVELKDSEVKGVESGTVYQVDFNSEVDFEAVVGVPLKVGDAQQYATMYSSDTFSVTEMSSAVVDDNGYAWFPAADIDPQKDYYVGVNVEGADTSNAFVPDSILERYGDGSGETLTDAAGTRYQVGERESRWGITGKQFTVYVVIGLGALILVIAGTMITMNSISKSRAKYAAMAESASIRDEIDEDALRLQVMQEMLEEARNRKNGE